MEELANKKVISFELFNYYKKESNRKHIEEIQNKLGIYSDNYYFNNNVFYNNFRKYM